MSERAPLPPVYIGDAPDWFFPVVIIFAGLMLAWTLHALFLRQASKEEKLMWLAFWTLGPALWFSMEYHWLYPRWGNHDTPNAFERFKYAQEVSSKFWAAVVALVGAVVLKEK